MKKNSTPHDPLDDLLAAAVHGELTSAQRAELDSLLQNDPAARAAYQEIQTMHDLLERNHKEIRPDESFEERMISAVRRKARDEKAHRETMWESAVVLWRVLKRPFVVRPVWTSAAVGAVCLAILIGFFYTRQQVRGVFATINSQLQLAQSEAKAKVDSLTAAAQPVSKPPDLAKIRDAHASWSSQPGNTAQFQSPKLGRIEIASAAGDSITAADNDKEAIGGFDAPSAPTVTTQNGLQTGVDKVTNRNLPESFEKPKLGNTEVAYASGKFTPPPSSLPSPVMFGNLPTDSAQKQPQPWQTLLFKSQAKSGESVVTNSAVAMGDVPLLGKLVSDNDTSNSKKTSAQNNAPATPTITMPVSSSAGSSASDGTAGMQAKDKEKTDPSRKLIRDAQLDLQVKSFQKTVDSITEFAKAAGGYLDSSNSQRGGNGKLQGAVVVKVLPENLDAFLLKLRDLGEIKNQSVSTQDVTKDYIDTQARLTNSQHMEAQLTLLLQHTNGKVSDLLQVERELERVRGEIEQMQGQLKLYDFQVQYATITINVAEKDLNKAAAYLLQEHDQFALFVHDVEDAFAQAKTAADTFKAEILNADLEHGANNTMSATLAFSVPPDQIDGFLNKVRSLGRVDNFTRTTQRVANDGGDPDQPADDTRTEKDHVQVQLTIRADDESPRQQTQLAIASTGDIDTQAQALKDDAAKSGANVIASNFQRAPDGNETATISFRLALSKVVDFMPVIEKLGRVESLTVQRNDRPDQAAADPNAPAQIDLTLHNVAAVSFENEPPRQATQLVVSSHDDVDAQSQQVKGDAIKAGVAVTGSTFERQPDGTELAALTFRLSLAQAAAFTAKLEELGKVESLAVQRNDVAGPNSTDPNAPAEISLSLHSEPAVVAEDRGVWATIRETVGGGLMAFFSSIATIGVVVAYVVPWLVLLVLVAWMGRRVYIVWIARKAA